MNKGGSADYGYSMSVELCVLCGDAKGLSHGCVCTGNDALLAALNAMTDEDRLGILGNYCQYCGSKDRGCQCWNDE